MREILFRGKRCDNGEWVQGYYIKAEHHWHKHGIHKDWIICGASANGGWFALHNKYAVKAETVGQFIGLTDKNGKKIWEGDIVAWNSGEMDIDGRYFDDEIFFVKFSSRIFGFAKNYGAKYSEETFEGETGRDLVVIGNLHDNPELLENP